MTPGTPCGGGVTATLVQPLANRLVMYAAVAIENAAQGMASGAFGVLLLRLTQKQFSSTQYALFSSIFAIGRALAGPPAGLLVDAVGWTPFFLLSVLASVPGLVLLHKFAPLSARGAGSRSGRPSRGETRHARRARASWPPLGGGRPRRGSRLLRAAGGLEGRRGRGGGVRLSARPSRAWSRRLRRRTGSASPRSSRSACSRAPRPPRFSRRGTGSRSIRGVIAARSPCGKRST